MKQKNPVANDSSIAKDALVSFWVHIISFQIKIFFGRSGSSLISLIALDVGIL